MDIKQYKILVSGNAPKLYPTDTFFGLLYDEEDDAMEIPKRYPYKGEWGEVLSNHLLNKDDYYMPFKIDMVWLSIVERKFYSIETYMPVLGMEELWKQQNKETEELLFTHIVVGMAPYGGVALWFNGFDKSILIGWLKAKEINVDIADFKPTNPDTTLDEICNFYINNDAKVKENLEKNGLPPKNLFDKYMQQFIYRYLPIFEKFDSDEKKWQKYKEDETVPEFGFIEEALFDGTHDKLHDDNLLKYHEAGKPKKLAIKWHKKKTEYVAYFWFEDEKIREVFDKFYGAHPDTKTDFIIRIDVENKKYELALYRYGLKEPQVIPEDVYQLLVFKNKFEDYRSENYNQERGAWIW